MNGFRKRKKLSAVNSLPLRNFYLPVKFRSIRTVAHKCNVKIKSHGRTLLTHGKTNYLTAKQN